MRILIVEDEYALADVLRDRLEDENYCVDLAADGEDGLYQGLTGIYDIILLDIMMPKMNGMEVIQRLRKGKTETPVLMMTAKSALEDKVTGLDSGADDYLTKPFEMDELLARIRALTRREKAIRTKQLTFGDLLLDQQACQLVSLTSQEKVKMGAKEFLLMEYFLKNKDQILSREQISEKIWGYQSDAEYNNVEVYISFLRKKITFIHSSVQIKAVRGVGYQIEDSNKER